MNVIKEYNGRIFTESEFFEPRDRRIAGLSSNNVWLYTVERGTERDRDTGQQSKRTIVRVVRWVARNDSSNKRKIWRYRRSYNIRSIEEWETVSNIVDSLIGGSRKTDSFISIPFEEYNKLYADSRQRKSEKRKMIAKIRDLRNIGSATEAELHLYQQRLSLMRANVQELESTLRKYKTLITNNATTETQVHEFLIENDVYWMFGLEYVSIKSKVSFPPGKKEYEFDLMLHRYDEFWDLVELKGPNENLFDKRTQRRSIPNRKLSEAIEQVFIYLYVVDKMGDESIVKPKAYIVIGKEEKDRPSERRILSSNLSNVELITHSDLYERGQLLLKHIKDTYPMK